MRGEDNKEENKEKTKIVEIGEFQSYISL